MKFVLPMSEGYVKHWGIWEAVRELIQNAYDERDRNPECKVVIEPLAAGGVIISTSMGRLSKSSLVLGNSDKFEAGMRGQFGEGYKLALLVLCRLGLEVKVINADEVWTPKIEHSDEFDSKVLVIETSPLEPAAVGVRFEIRGDVDMTAIGENLWEGEGVLDEPGRVYVGGLYVTTLKDFKKGYSFKTMKLDRDRCMVSDFDVALETSKMWLGRSDSEAIALVEAEAPDVRYVDCHFASESTPLVRGLLLGFEAAHGADALPVDSQAEIERASAAGRKWVLVKSAVKKLLSRVKDLFVPSRETPADRLEALLKREYLAPTVRAELEDILKVLRSMEVM